MYPSVIAIPRFIAGKVNLKTDKQDVINYRILDRQGGLSPDILVEDSRANVLEAFYAWNKADGDHSFFVTPAHTSPEERALYEAINLPGYIEFIDDSPRKILVGDIPYKEHRKSPLPFWGISLHIRD